MVRFVTIPRASVLTGYTEDAIRSKIRDDIWREGKEWIRAPDDRILIDMEGYEKWVETGEVLKLPRKAASKSRSSTRAGAAASGSLSSPRPLI
ncbi:excisionase [Achromobacter aegrifaciens]|nr:excisionase [Achromobacter aegrifaciens]